MAGYHINEIPQGKAGELSKLVEEVQEALDAEQQDVRIMVLVELSDLYGAIDLYLEKHFPGFTMSDLAAMSQVTHRAFIEGYRTTKNGD